MSGIEASSCKLYNPVAAIRWNIDKHYLFDLEKWGVPIIPTYRASEIEPGLLLRELTEQDVGSVILKPAVGLGGSGSSRLPLDHLASRLAAIQANPLPPEYLVQPFIDSVVT